MSELALRQLTLTLDHTNEHLRDLELRLGSALDRIADALRPQEMVQCQYCVYWLRKLNSSPLIGSCNRWAPRDQTGAPNTYPTTRCGEGVKRLFEKKGSNDE